MPNCNGLPLFYGTAPHAAPPFPLPYGGGALLREPSPPPNGRFRIDIRAAREYDSLLALGPKKRDFFPLFLHPVPNAEQATTSCTKPPSATAGCHLVGTIVGHKKVLARTGNRPALTEIAGLRSKGVSRHVLPTFEGEKTAGQKCSARFLVRPPPPSTALPAVPGGHVSAHWPCSPPPP